MGWFLGWFGMVLGLVWFVMLNLARMVLGNYCTAVLVVFFWLEYTLPPCFFALLLDP